jgi:hypothetical protein
VVVPGTNAAPVEHPRKEIVVVAATARGADDAAVGPPVSVPDSVAVCVTETAGPGVTVMVSVKLMDVHSAAAVMPAVNPVPPPVIVIGVTFVVLQVAAGALPAAFKVTAVTVPPVTPTVRVLAPAVVPGAIPTVYVQFSVPAAAASVHVLVGVSVWGAA